MFSTAAFDNSVLHHLFQFIREIYGLDYAICLAVIQDETYLSWFLSTEKLEDTFLSTRNQHKI